MHPRCINLIIFGECASKANSRRIVKFGQRLASIKSQKALSFAASVARQVAVMPVLLEGDLSFTATIYYATRRPDLDESALLDALQGRVYLNDRQIKAKHIYHALDRQNPRAEVHIETLPAPVGAPTRSKSK